MFGWDVTPRCRVEETFPWRVLDEYPYIGLMHGATPELFKATLEGVKRQALDDSLAEVGLQPLECEAAQTSDMRFGEIWYNARCSAGHPSAGPTPEGRHPRGRTN